MRVKEETEQVALKLNIQKTNIMASGPIISWQTDGEGNNGNSDRLYFGGAPKSLGLVTAAMKLKDTPWKESYAKTRQHIKKQRDFFTDKGPFSQSYGFSSSQ